MNFKIKYFFELTTTELYQILQLRSEVFVIEQNCVYQDVDDKDQKALHIFGLKNDKIMVYARIIKPGEYYKNASFGRVLVYDRQRKQGYGHAIVKKIKQIIITNFKTDKITISAQTYLQEFYKSHGFTKVGEEYLEDGIPHIEMLYTIQ